MTSRAFLGLMLRRWYLLLLGAAITLAVAATTTDRGSVYWTEFHVVLLSPTNEDFPNELEDPPYSLAPLGGVIVAEYNGTNPSLLTSSSDTTNYGMGERTGVMVRMPNQGNQWFPTYSSPNIDVQVVDRSPERVLQQSQQVKRDLEGILERLQRSVRVAPGARVSMISSPAEPAIVHVAGSRMRALGALGIVGASLTAVSIYWLERLLIRRRKSSPAGASAATLVQGTIREPAQTGLQ